MPLIANYINAVKGVSVALENCLMHIHHSVHDRRRFVWEKYPVADTQAFHSSLP
jgi:hypothetical protein